MSKTAKEIAKEYGWTSQSIIAAMEEYASQLHPSPTPDVTEAVFGAEFVKWADENELTKQSGGNLAISIINQFINSKTKNNEQQ